MNILAKIKKSLRRVWNSTATSTNKITMSQIMELFSSSYTDLGSDLSEIVFFTCLKILSESIGKIPCYLLDNEKKRISTHDTTWFLSIKPNEFMTPAQFFTHLEFDRNYYGNAYVYVNRNKDGTLKGLYPLSSRCMQIWINDSARFTEQTYYYQYSDTRTGKLYYFLPDELLHFKSWITDDTGLAGKSVREILATSFAGAKSSTKFLNDLYQNGLTANAVVKYTGDLKRESQDKLLDEIIRQSNDKGRRLITIPMGFDLQKLDLSLTDSQFFELKKYSALQVAAAFGVQPAQLNDLTKSSYASEAAQQVSFLSSTLLYIISSYEQELNCKLLSRKEILEGRHFKFNVSVLLRTNPETQADIIQKMIQNSVYSVNEARYLLDKEPCENGDTRIVNGSFVPLSKIGIAYAENIEGGDINADHKE